MSMVPQPIRPASQPLGLSEEGKFYEHLAVMDVASLMQYRIVGITVEGVIGDNCNFWQQISQRPDKGFISAAIAHNHHTPPIWGQSRSSARKAFLPD